MNGAPGGEAVLGRRVAAGALDLLAVAQITIPVALIAGQTPASLSGSAFIWWIILAGAYYAVPEAIWGTSLFKRVVGLRVQRAGGGHPKPWQIGVRTIVRVIDLLPIAYLLGFIVILASGARQQRLGDLAARTKVVARTR